LSNIGVANDFPQRGKHIYSYKNVALLVTLHC